MAKHTAHIVYKNKDGKIVPGVTTIIGQLAKPMLAPAANKLGLSGIDSTSYWKSLADIGSLAHEIILAHVQGVDFDAQKNMLEQDYTGKEMAMALDCFKSYRNWQSKHEIEPILSEAQLVSEQWQYGGTLDCFCKLDGVDTLIDFKTGGIYNEALIQVSAYQQLLCEYGHYAKQALILGIPRAEGDAFTERTYTNFEKGWETFYVLLQLYPLMKIINRDKGE